MCALRVASGLLVHSVTSSENSGYITASACTTRERALPGLEVLRNLGHLDIGVEFFDLVHYGVLVVVFIVVPPLLSRTVTSQGLREARNTHLVLGHACDELLELAEGNGVDPTWLISGSILSRALRLRVVKKRGHLGKRHFQMIDVRDPFGRVMQESIWANTSTTAPVGLARPPITANSGLRWACSCGAAGVDGDRSLSLTRAVQAGTAARTTCMQAEGRN